ncbi:MAG: hypothetical protein LBV13_00115 [Methanomassiliicoccaceae archaeon]|jgi:tetratricopeptide (TPR) repeat protein|nr:hypothetical protein [Methanomassiliicoccaceae archaeon]
MDGALTLGNERILKIAKKYYDWAKPIISLGKNEFKKAVDWVPEFDGRKNDVEKAGTLSFDTAMLGTFPGTGTITVAFACAAFDLAPESVVMSQNLGSAIALFCDNSPDLSIKEKKKEIYEDAAAVLIYAVSLSLSEDMYTEKSLGPLVALGNLFLDMEKYEEAKHLFTTARRLDETYMPAVEGLAAYYKAVKKPQLAGMVREGAKKNPTGCGRSANEIDKNVKKATEISQKGDANEEEMEKDMDKAETVEAPNYGDLFDSIDQATAAKIRNNRKELNNRMVITVPNLDILFPFTDITEDNQISVKSAVAAVAEEIPKLIKYMKRLPIGAAHRDADILENTGIGDFYVRGMKFHDFMRDAANNPQKYEDSKINAEGKIRTDNANKFIKDIKDGIAETTAARHGMEGGDRFGKNLMRTAAKAEAVLFPLSLNPFKYANAWDILLQQYNAMPLIRKRTLLFGYMAEILRKRSKILFEVQRNYHREYGEINDIFKRELDDLKERYQKQIDIINKMISDCDDQGCGRCKSLSKRIDDLSDQHEVDKHKLHLKYYPQLNQCTKRFWLEGTGVAIVMYKKLERNAPRMYKEVMKHLVYISDEKVRAEQEDILVGTIAQSIASAIGLVLGAYGMGEILRIEQCGCDFQATDELEERLKKEKKEKDYEMLMRQKAARDSFKSGAVDENSAFYKNYLKQWEYSFDVGFFKYKVNDHFTTTHLNIDLKLGSFDYSSFQSNITKAGSVKADLTLKLEKQGVDVKGEATFGFTYVWDKNGNPHPDGFDLRAGLKATASLGPIETEIGISSSVREGFNATAGAKVSGEQGPVSAEVGVTASTKDGVDANAELVVSGEYGPATGDAKVSVSTKDGVDASVSAEVSGSKGPLQGEAKASASLQGGVKASAEAKMSGNEYIDALKEAALGETLAENISLPNFDRELWGGEYSSKGDE